MQLRSETRALSGFCLQYHTMNLANSIRTTSRLSVVLYRYMYGITTVCLDLTGPHKSVDERSVKA